jgi:transcriptional regulator with XRE-family HTH domain
MKKETVKGDSSKVLQRIIKKRQELGVSQMDLAFKLHLSANGYFKIEKGHSKLDVNRLLQIAKVLSVSPVVFFED